MRPTSVSRRWPRGLALLAAAALYVAGCSSHRALHPDSLVDLEGRRHSLGELRGPHATVFVFLSVDCPIANRALPELAALESALLPRGVRFVPIYAAASESAAEIRRHRAEYSLVGPAFRDPDFAVARRLGARFTPEAVALAADDRLIYLGRVNDQYQALGQSRPAPTRHDLAETLEGFLVGAPAAGREVPVVGCTFRAP